MYAVKQILNPEGMSIAMKKIKYITKWFITFIICFLIIYLTVFFGGWRLFESNDPILIEIGVALVLSIFVFSINEAIEKLETRIKELEEHISRLESKETSSENITE